MDNDGLVWLVYETLNNYYKTHIEDWRIHIASPSVWFDLFSLYHNELVLLGYDLETFTSDTMDDEMEKLVVFGHGSSSIGMDWEKDDDGFEGFFYWIE